MRVCLFEDHADNLEPLSLTRPVFDLICGRTSLAWKQLRYWAPREYGLLLRPHLQELALLGNTTMRVNDLGWLGADTTVMVNGRWLPPEGSVTLPAGPCVGLAGGEVAFAVVTPEQVHKLSPVVLPDFLERW